MLLDTGQLRGWRRGKHVPGSAALSSGFASQKLSLVPMRQARLACSKTELMSRCRTQFPRESRRNFLTAAARSTSCGVPRFGVQT